MFTVLLLAVTVAATPVKATPRPLFRWPKAVRDLAPEMLERARTRGPRPTKPAVSIVHPTTEASPDQVWAAITTANPRMMWHNRSATFRTTQRTPDLGIMDRWQGLRVGDTLLIDIHAVPHTPALDLGVGLEVRKIDPTKKELVFAYTEIGPAAGTQVIKLEPKLNRDGTIGTRVTHSSSFQGRSLVEHLAYRPLHRLVLHDLWKSIFNDAARISPGAGTP